MEEYEDLPIGIDLGTTYSCIAVYRNGAVEIIPNEKGDRTTPSVVTFLDDDILVGEQTEYKRFEDPTNKIYAIKRIIGRDFNDKEVQEDISNFSYNIKNDNGRPQIEVNSKGIKTFSPEEISAKILSKLKKSAEKFLQKKIEKVVITVPAYFTERQKQATKVAGEIAGLNVIKIINEPLAASLAYGFGNCLNNNNEAKFGKNIIFEKNDFKKALSRQNTQPCAPEEEEAFIPKDKNINDKSQNILIFDLGGGTLDVTLLELEKGDITIKAHSGKMHLGGEDFDNILIEYCIQKFKLKTNIDLSIDKYKKQKERLKNHCIKAKIELSYDYKTTIDIESITENDNFYLKLTRKDFEELCKDKFDLCLEPVKDVLEKAKIDKNNIDEVILVGGSTKIPKIRSLLENFFNNKELNNRLNPDEAVAYGAAIEAALIMGRFEEDVSLLDVCPFSLGISIHNDKENDNNGRLMKKIIKKGTKLPYKTNLVVNPAHNNPDSINIEVYEGENIYVKDNYPLGSFRLLDIPDKKKEDIDINVIFELDENSILTVSAEIEENNCKNSMVIIDDKGGLPQSKIDNFKKKEEEYYEQDNLEPAMAIEHNYKKEINNLESQINKENDPQKLFNLLQCLQYNLESFIVSFYENIEDEDKLKEKIHFYLKHLFITYSYLLNYDSMLIKEEKEEIILNIQNCLEIFKKDINYCLSLIKQLENIENYIFCDFCIQILKYYSEKGTDYYSKNEKKYSKHYFEEGLSLNKKYSLEERVQSNEILNDLLKPILNNCKELINILKAESIGKYSESFSNNNLIDESEFTNNEQIFDILDRFKEAIKYLKNPTQRADKILKAFYLANIAKIEFKIFHSYDYDTLISMIDDCIKLKESARETDLSWFDEIKKIKSEMKDEQKKNGKNYKDIENKIKQKIENKLDLINSKFKEGEINFFLYILTQYKPNGLDDSFMFITPDYLETIYFSNKNKFLKKLIKYYNPERYNGKKEEQIKTKLIMREISMLLNKIN